MKWLSGLLIVAIAACCGPPESSTIEDPEPISVAINAENDPEWLVRVEFAFYASDLELYPEVIEQFTNAIVSWSGVLPIEVAVFVMSPVNENVDDIDVFRPDVVKFKLADSDLVQGERDLLGAWDWTKKEITLDVVDLRDEDGNLIVDRTYTTILHELGHVFGLTHITNQGTLEGTSGDIVLPETHDSRDYLMHPHLTETNLDGEISQLEIDIATEFVRTQLQRHLKGMN